MFKIKKYEINIFLMVDIKNKKINLKKHFNIFKKNT